jgi:hypothetical protein
MACVELSEKEIQHLLALIFQERSRLRVPILNGGEVVSLVYSKHSYINHYIEELKTIQSKLSKAE